MLGLDLFIPIWDGPLGVANDRTSTEGVDMSMGRQCLELASSRLAELCCHNRRV